MSRSRGHGNVYTDEAFCKPFINSKAIFAVFITCFLQRRLNTSYTKKLCTDLFGHTLRMREKWSKIERNYRSYAISTIELYDVDADNEVIGAAHVDGSVFIKTNRLRMLRYWTYRRIEDYLQRFYTSVEQDGGTMYLPKTIVPRLPAVTTPVVAGESFATIMNREWSV